MQPLWLCWGCGGEHTLPLSLRIMCFRAESLTVPTVRSPVMGTHKRLALWMCRPPVSGPRGSDLVTSLPHVPCYGPLQEPLQQTHFYDSDTVRAWVTRGFLFALSHSHTHAPVQHVFIPLRGRAYMRLSLLFAGVLPNRYTGCLTWTCFTDFFLKLQLWAPDCVRYGSGNKQS